MTTTVDLLASVELDRHMGQLTRRLADELHLATDRVEQVVEEERGRFAEAHIHAFLPILIERSARARLR